jgi:hypothetical protein
MSIIEIDVITNTVASLGHPESLGTATLVVHKDRAYVLTAAHVAKLISLNGLLVLKGPGDIPISITMSKLCGTAPYLWRTHGEADLAALELSPTDVQTQQILSGRLVPMELFCPLKAAPSRELMLTSVGFPMGLGLQGYFSPLTFETRASSGLITMNRADTQTPQAFFVLERPSVAGYSGCPVLDTSSYSIGGMKVTGGGTCFYGVMHGTVSDNTGGKLAVVTPSYYVHELFAAF